MDAFTISYAAAVIAAVVAVVQVVTPNVLVLIMTAVLNEEHSAVTWSVVGRAIGSSHWPMALHSDMVASRTVPFYISMIVRLRPIILVLTAIAAVITPSGLYETTRLADEAIPVSFVYLSDPGPFGLATLPRSEIGYSRLCGGARLHQCPGTENVVIFGDGDGSYNTSIPDCYDRRIPQITAELFQSGLRSQQRNVSSFFDIHSRYYRTALDLTVDNRTFLRDVYQDSASVLDASGLKVVEGLIIDTINGRVGFRNHSVPVASQIALSAEWEEGILFFEPETSCTDLNITLDFELEDNQLSRTSRSLIDEGGFVHSPRENPFPVDRPAYGEDLQNDLKLEARAYRVAWALNRLSMYFPNISQPQTDLSYVASSMGQKFEINNSVVLSRNSIDALKFQDLWTSIIEVLLTSYTYENDTMSVNETGTFDAYFESKYDNPWEISSNNYSYFDQWCSGTEVTDVPNAKAIDTRCGIVVGAATSKSSSDPYASNVTQWNCPIYTCASATKAVIRTVRFRYNATVAQGSEQLSVVAIKEKLYADQQSEPLWGVETANTSIVDVSPFWGLIEAGMANSANLTTIQNGHLYLPVSASSYWGSAMANIDSGSDYLPAISGAARIWSTAYSGGDSLGMPDYTGENRKYVANKWKTIGYNTSSTAKILNLIWTDIASVYFVGGRGQHTSESLPPNLVQTHLGNRRRDEPPTQTAQAAPGQKVPVYLYQRVVRFRWVYGIPALICLLL